MQWWHDIDKCKFSIHDALSMHSTIYTIILHLSVAVRKLQVAILARSSREMYQTVRIDWQYILSRDRV